MKIIDCLTADIVDLSGLDRVEQISDDALVFRNSHRRTGLTMVKLPRKSIERIELMLKLQSMVCLIDDRGPDDAVAAQDLELPRGAATRDEPMI
jgi:hypothetical protein